MNSDLYKNIKIVIYMKDDLALNNLQWMTSHKSQPTLIIYI